MDISRIFDEALKQGVIVSDKTDKTMRMLKEADIVLEKAIKDDSKKLKGKIVDGKIKNSIICGATIEEVYNGTTYERPVIDLVQQGGGMYGIALLGYTYAMEKVGIRFYSHGGTSAGAINAMFLAAMPNEIYQQESPFKGDEEHRQATKSEVLTHIIANTAFSSFMERDDIIGRLQSKLFKNLKSVTLKLLVAMVVVVFLVSVYGIFSGIFSISNGLSGFELRSYDFIIGTLNVLALLVLGYILLVKVVGKSFGINKGSVFYEWANKLLRIIEIDDTSSLEERMYKTQLKDRLPSDKPRLVLITSNLTHNRIVKFPERAGDYWKNPERIKPGAYLRATMSLPFIYYAFVPDVKHYASNPPNDPIVLKARFVDGGMLSNFPIREFHRNDNIAPRFPTFGVLLSEREIEKNGDDSEAKTKLAALKEFNSETLIKYILSFISTFRNFYDNAFLFQNKEIEKRIVTVNTKGFNWLDFWMDDKTKRELFLKGVDAAIEQLEKFEWENYLEIRKSKNK